MSNTEIKHPLTPDDQERYDSSITKGLEVIASGATKQSTAEMLRDSFSCCGPIGFVAYEAKISATGYMQGPVFRSPI